MRTSLLVSLILVLVLTGIGVCAENPDAKVAIHLLPRDCERGCARKFPVISDPCDIVAIQTGCGDFDFFPVFYDLNECYCMEYAVEWPGSYSCIFTMCAYSHIGEIIWSGDWIAQCFGGCQTGYSAIPGWGWITVDEPGQVCMVPVPETGEISILNCSQHIDHPVENYCAGVCGADGDEPCSKAMVRSDDPTTWGSIKSMFR